MPQVCRFYQSPGGCKFGDGCKFEHPGASRQGNRFSTFGNKSSGSLPYSLSKDTIEKDLREEAPQWILSCYGPGRDAPEQLFGGYPREQSTDEIRLHYEKGVQAGRQQEVLQEINQLYETASQQMQTVLSNIDNAIQFVADGAKNQPNRLTVVESTNPPGRTPGEFSVGKRPVGGGRAAAASSAGSNPFGGGTSGAFGGGGSTGGSAFGRPSAMGQGSSPFGGGAPGTSGTGGAFGQPSTGGAFGKPAAPAFGSTSAPGSAFGSASAAPATSGSAFGQPSAFGQQSQASGGGAFGQPSAMGQRPSAFGAPAFGQTAQPAGGSAFGQPSQLGGGGSAFGQPSALGQKPSPFGAPSAGSGGGFSAFAGASGAPGTSPFGAAAQPATSSPFGQSSQPAAASPFGAAAAQPAAGSSPFGAQPAASSPFGAGNGQPVASNPFGAAQGAGQAGANPFAKQDGGMETGMDAQPTGGFGQPQQPQQQQGGSAFGQQQQAQAAPNPFGQPQQSGFGAAAPAAGGAGGASPYPPDSGKQHPPLESYATQSMGRLASWKGRPVTYRDGVPGYIGQSGKWARIWFPGGPPAYYAETEEAPGEASEAERRAWEGFGGRFDVVPEVPPLRVDCRWDI